MKNSSQLLVVIFALMATGVTAAALRAADVPSDPSQAPARGPRHGPPPEIMAIYDVDQNNELDEDERAVLHEDIASGKIEPPWGRRGPGGGRGLGQHRLPAEILARYDANGDGRLDDTEHAALRADVQAGKVKLPPRGPGRGMRRQLPVEIMSQYDTDQDGTLNDAERAVLHADIASGKIAPPHRGHGPKPETP